MSTRMKRKRIYKKKAKRRLYLSFLIIFSLLFVTTAVYATFQFNAGQNKAEDKLTADDQTKLDEDEDKDEVEVKEPENNEPINVLLVGIDSIEGEPARTDTIMIAQYDPDQNEAKIASIMRDTYLEIPDHSNNKINAAFAYGGADLLRETIEHNFDLDIHYYAMVNFDSFTEVVDIVAPDGLEVDIEKRMYYNDNAGGVNIDFQPGVQMLNGEEALKYVRFRADNQNDFGRVQRQQDILQLLKEELFTFSGITRIPRLIGAVEPHIDTNIKTGTLISLGKDVALNPIKDIKSLRIPVDGAYKDEYYSHAGSVLEIDVQKNSEALKEFFSNEQLITSDSNTENEDVEETEF